jgi:Skp family chaperone for outer membrane proteins
MLLLAGSSEAQQPGAPPAAQPAQPTARPTIAVFNMAAVMRDYGKAKYQVYQLNEERKRLSADLVVWRAEYIKLQEENTKSLEPNLREANARRMLELSRKIQDKDQEVNKTLNEKASQIISTLYDEIKTVVDKTAEMNGYHIVFAYPAAVTAEEQKSPMVKELMLKPPAAQPFYVARHVDLTNVIIQTLNTWYAAPAVPADAKTGGAPSTTPPPTQNPQPGTVPGGR